MVVYFTVKKCDDKFRVHCEVESKTHSPGFTTGAFSTKKQAIKRAEKMLKKNWDDWRDKSVPCNPNDYILIDKSLCCVCNSRSGEHMCVTCLEQVCWKCNWAKSCLAVCKTCHDNEELCKRCGLSKDYDCIC